jgi:MFS family permease
VPALGFAGVLWAASARVIAERVGKAVRSPAKDTMVSHATSVVGRGKGFAVHEAMDQVGALAGPLAVAGMLALTDDDYGPSLAVLALPGVAALALLLWLRARVPRPEVYEPGAVAKERPTIAGSARLPRAFSTYATFTGATMLGFTTFGLVSFHLVTDGLVADAAVPLLYAAVMAADAVSALVTGWAYDRVGARVLASLPVLSAGAVALAFTSHLWIALAGTLLWGAALGIQESTLRATVADLVPPGRRATAYGVFAAVLGGAAAVGGGLTGALYDASPRALVATVVAIEAAALVLLLALSRVRPPLPQA